MKRLGTILILVACLALVLCAFAPGAMAAKGKTHGGGAYAQVIPPKAMPGGQSYGDWSVGWWQWMFGQPAESCPNFDMTGEGFPWGQDRKGRVLYLPGSWGGPATRSFTVPTGRMLFVPLINAAYVLFPGDPVDWSFVTGFMATVTAADLTVDGRQMDLFRPAYQVGLQAPFQTWFPEENILGEAAGYYTCGEDGYYAMLAPLSRGTHRVVVHGATNDGFSVDLIYNVTVR
jgi:hypothetical protein